MAQPTTRPSRSATLTARRINSTTFAAGVAPIPNHQPAVSALTRTRETPAVAPRRRPAPTRSRAGAVLLIGCGAIGITLLDLAVLIAVGVSRG